MVWKESISKGLSQIRHFTNLQLKKPKKHGNTLGMFTSIKRYAQTRIFSPSELATGLEKKLMDLWKAGHTDPYEECVMKRGPGTINCPNLVPSAFDKRLVGCICEPEQYHVCYMWLHKGTPKRCFCGHWFKLIEKSPV